MYVKPEKWGTCISEDRSNILEPVPLRPFLYFTLWLQAKPQTQQQQHHRVSLEPSKIDDILTND